MRIGKTPMMWTDLHRGHLAQMKKCISTEIEDRPGNAQHRIMQACGIHDSILAPDGICRRKLR